MLQAVQLAAFVTILYVDPATQETQPVFARVVHTVDRYIPAAQIVQALQTLFVVTVQAVD